LAGTIGTYVLDPIGALLPKAGRASPIRSLDSRSGERGLPSPDTASGPTVHTVNVFCSSFTEKALNTRVRVDAVTGRPMGNFPLFLLLTTVMGLSIFVSLPLVYYKRAQGRWAVGLNAGAVGILVFLLADIFSNVSVVLYPAGSFVANFAYSLLFGGAFLVAFVGLFLVDHLPRGAAGVVEGGPRLTALIIALGIGLQNLTEGLVFGASWVRGTLGILAVVFTGFLLQNVSEGFPIASPFLGTTAKRGIGIMAGLFLLGGLPTILGGVMGYYWSNDTFLVLFDALAVGAIVYVILPMLRVAFRPLETKEASIRRNRIVYVGVMVGFLVGFAVNAI
jgi:zinc transporter, ZIP family